MLSLCRTPFGAPVVPEVKARYVIWFGSSLGRPVERRSRQIGERPLRRPARPARRSAGNRGRPARRKIVVGPVGIGAVAGLRDQRGGAHPVDQRDDLVDRVVAVQRRAADIAVARAGQQRDRGLDPARQPYRDALAGPHAVARKTGREPVGGGDQRRVAQPAMPVADREGVGRLRALPRRRARRASRCPTIRPPCRRPVSGRRAGSAAARSSSALRSCRREAAL